MNTNEADAVKAELAALNARAEAVEQRAKQAETERDVLRNLLARIRTSLAETSNDPGAP